MKLTSHTDFGLRLLMTLAVMQDKIVTIEELAERHGLSRNHLMKVAQSLVGAGFVTGVRGRNGGLKLSRAPEDIRIGDVVRKLEEDMSLVPCLSKSDSSCIFVGLCGLTSAMSRALESFLRELDAITLADLTRSRRRLATRVGAF